jgi:hypothetical protein
VSADSLSRVFESLDRIVESRTISRESARALEGHLLEACPDADDDERFEDLLHALASFQPGGGDFLYDERHIVDCCERVLRRLRATEPER